MRWTPEFDALAQWERTEPANARELLVSRISELGFSATPLDQRLRLRGVVRGRDPDLARTLAGALTRDDAELAALLPGLETRAEGSDPPEALARLVAYGSELVAPASP